MGKVITGHCAAVAAAQHRKKTCMNAVYILIVVSNVINVHDVQDLNI